MMAPILSFLSEEVHGYTPQVKAPSVFLEDFPQVKTEWIHEESQRQMDLVMEIREAALKTLEPMRKNREIGSSLDAQLTLSAPEESLQVLRSLQGDGRPDYLREVLMVSQVNLQPASELKITASRAHGEKCPRCWHYTTKPSTLEKLLGICPKCVEALQ